MSTPLVPVRHSTTCTATTTTIQVPASGVTNIAKAAIYIPPHRRDVARSILAIKAQLVPNREVIVNFVNTSILFQSVIDKHTAIDRLVRVSSNWETAGKLERLALLFNKGPMNITNLFFSDPDFEELVVLAHIAKKITYSQLGTAFYRKAILDECGSAHLREVPLFLSNGRINPEARDLMELTVKTSQVSKGFQTMENFLEGTQQPAGVDSRQTGRQQPVLQNHDIDKWFLLMRNAPASEQMLLVGKMRFDGVQVINAFKANWANPNISPQERLGLFKDAYKASIMDAVYTIRSNLFNRVRVILPDGTKGEAYRIFPSMDMATTLFKMKGDHCHLVFRLGVSDKYLVGKRNIAIPSSFQPLPTKVRGFCAASHDYTSYNLCCNAYFASLIHEGHQKLFTKIGDILVLESHQLNANPYMRFIAECCYEMDGSLYRPEMQREIMDSMPLLQILGDGGWNDASKFAYSLLRHVGSAKERRLMVEMQTIYKCQELSEREQDRLASQMLEELVSQPLDEIIVSALDTIIDHFETKAHLSPFEEKVIALLRQILLVKVRL